MPEIPDYKEIAKIEDVEERIRIWQELGTEAILAAGWQMVVDRHFEETGEILLPHIDRTVEFYGKISEHPERL